MFAISGCAIIGSTDRIMTPLDTRLDQSCLWIKENWNAFNVDVPDQLLREWMHQDNADGPPPSGFHLAVFTFGYIQYQLLHDQGPPGATRTVCATKILELYYHWQVKLALACLDRRTDIRTSALRLFSFDENEEVEIIRRAP